MAFHNDLGKRGEQLAVSHLEESGYQILERNWTSGKAEVDIIAQKDGVLAVVEVKTRSSDGFGLPQDFVTPKKIRLLTAAIDRYVELKGIDVTVRFDILAVLFNAGKVEVVHLSDAFFHF